MFRQRPLAPVIAIIAFLLLAPSAHAQVAADGYRNAHRLGGRTSFYKPPLTNVASLQRMAASPKMADDVRSVLLDAGLSDTSDAVLAMLSSGMPTVVSKSCADVTAADGVLVDCLFPRGGTLEWMAYRLNMVRGDRTPGHLTKVRWAGQPFRAFLFRVTTGISLWDLTRTDTFTPAWLLHAGVPLGHSRVYLVGEGRLFLDHADDVSNNYLLWAGLRARF